MSQLKRAKQIKCTTEKAHDIKDAQLVALLCTLLTLWSLRECMNQAAEPQGTGPASGHYNAWPLSKVSWHSAEKGRILPTFYLPHKTRIPICSPTISVLNFRRA